MVVMNSSGTTDSNVAPNEWISYAYSYDISQNKAFLYKNGFLIAQSPRNEYVNQLAGTYVGISVSPQGFDPAFKGNIDDIRFYTRVLLNNEVKNLYEYESVLHPHIATATANIVNGFVVGITIQDGGYGYTNAPAVSIGGGDGTGATAQATIDKNGVVTAITVLNPGSGYTSAPKVTIAYPPFPPRPATGTATIVNGFVVGAELTDGGYGYDAPPAVVLEGGGGTGASAVATVENKVVTGIQIINPGTGYTSAPEIFIASPPFSPRLTVAVSKVAVKLEVVLGNKYQLETSTDLASWTAVGNVFVAQREQLTQEFDVAATGRYFRIQQVP